MQARSTLWCAGDEVGVLRLRTRHRPIALHEGIRERCAAGCTSIATGLETGPGLSWRRCMLDDALEVLIPEFTPPCSIRGRLQADLALFSRAGFLMVDSEATPDPHCLGPQPPPPPFLVRGDATSGSEWDHRER